MGRRRSEHGRRGQPLGSRVRRRVFLVCLAALASALAWTGLAGGTQPYETYESKVASDGPVAQFRFDDEAGSGKVADSAGGYTATNSGIALAGEGPFGGSKSGEFGGEDYATLPGDPLEGAKEFTAEAWVDWAGGASYKQPVFDFGSSSSDYVYLTPASSLTSHKLLLEIHTSAGASAQVTATKLKAGNWEYLAVTETSAGTLTLYLNGEQVGQTTGVTVFPSSLGSAPADYLGKSLNSGESDFKGSLSNVAFYTKALPASQIEAHYNGAEFPVDTVLPKISGTVKDGSTLNAGQGTWTGLGPITYSFQWERCNDKGEACANVASATESTYEAGHEDVGSKLRVAVTATNSAGSGSATSAATATVEPLAPSNTVLPEISGEAEDGQLLTVSSGTWTGTPPLSYTYQWESCTGQKCTKISGAKASSYRVATSEIDDTLRATVTAENAAGSKTAKSAQTATVTAGPPVNTSSPTILGEAKEGQTLRTSSTGGWAGTAPITYAYQWQRCDEKAEACSNIAAATANSYTLANGDVGHTIRLDVTATNAQGSGSAASEPTVAVAAIPPSNTTLPSLSGEAEDGQALGASNGSWNGSQPISYSYQWLRCDDEGEDCAEIAGATSSSYTATSADVRHTLRVEVTARNAAGRASVSSAPSALVPSDSQCSDTWTGAAGDEQWQTAGNWSSGNVPGSGEQACIPAGASVNITEGSQQAGEVDGEGSLTISGGSLELTGTQPSKLAALSLSYGTLTGPGTLDLTSSFTLRDDGVIGGSGSLVIEHEAKGLIAASSGCDPMKLSQRTLINEGTLDYQWGTLEMANGATLRNAGTLEYTTQSVCYEPQILEAEGSSSPPAILNTGMFERTVEETGGVGVPFTNDGAVEAESGRLEFSDGGVAEEAATGSWTVAGDGSIALTGGTFLIAEAVDLSQVEVAGATVERTPSSGAPHGHLNPRAYAAGTVTISGFGQGAGSGFASAGIEVASAGRGEWQPLCGPLTPSLSGEFECQWNTNSGSYPDGSYELRAKLSDGSIPPNTSTTAAITVLVDNTPPTGSVSVPGKLDGEQPVSGTASDSGSGVASWQLQLASEGSGEWAAACPAQTSPTEGSTYECTVDALAHPNGAYELRALVTDRAGNVYTTTPASTTVANVPPQNTTPPSISGTAKQGQTLTASAGEWSGTQPIAYAYQWQRCNEEGEACASVSGATSSSYVLTGEDGGDTVRVVVTATNPIGSANADSAVSAVVPAPPSNTAKPTISGEAVEGEPLTASTGEWDGTGPITYSYQWELCEASGEGCSPIQDATASSYTPTSVGAIPRATVTATNAAGEATSTSEYAGVVQPRGVTNIEAPHISGVAEEGNALVASEGAWNGTPPLDVSYQWESCNALGEGCMAIPGATNAEYTLGASDVGSTVRVTVTAANSQSSTEGVSDASAVITPGVASYVSQFGSRGSGAGQFEEPSGVAVASNGDLWVADQRNDRVEEFSAAGEYLRDFGSAGSGEGELDGPTAVAVNSHGDVWVVDSQNDRIEEFSETGEYLSSFGSKGSGPGQFELPWGIAAGPEGNVWVSDPNNQRIEEFGETGEYFREVRGERFEGGLQEPKGIAVDPKGDVWVADASRHGVYEYSSSAEPMRHFTSLEGGPIGIAVDASGDVLVAEYEADRIEEFNEQGEHLGRFGSKGEGAAQFTFDQYQPQGVAAGPNGEIWVADYHGDSVQRWQAPQASAPVDTSSPGLSGQPVAGLTLTASHGEWEGSPVRYVYQWQRCTTECETIAGATAATYTLDNDDVGARIEVEVTAADASGATSATSSPTAAVAAATVPSNVTAPAISGEAQDGQTLRASPGEWSGTSASAYGYQWESCNEDGRECAAIEGASGPEYALGPGDVATALRVLVTATNDAGSAQASSAATVEVAPQPAGELEVPSVTGVPDSHQVLHADPGAWSGTERQFSYQWESCSPEGSGCAAIEGASEPEYELGEGDVGSTVRVRIGVASAAGALTDVSAATPVIGAPGTLASEAPPAISGAPQLGDMLSASQGDWAYAATASYAYQWQRCDSFGTHCANISGATSSTYAPVARDAGATLRAVVTASKETQSPARTSPTTQPVAAPGAPVAEQPPLVEGTTLKGQTLTATEGLFSAQAPLAYSFQWERCSEAGECTAITGASSATYELTSADVGSALRVLVTASDGEGSTTAVSRPSARIDSETMQSFTPPSVSGVVELGGELLAEPGIWSGAGSVSYGYQWESCSAEGDECAPIEGASEPAYLLSKRDLGSSLRVKVTATNPLGSQSAISAATVGTPAGEATVEQAEEAAQGADPAVLAPSTSATLQGQTVAPALGEETELYSKQTLTSSTISTENAGEFAVNTPDGELSFDPREASPQASVPPTIVNGTAALFANTSPATDTIVRPSPLGATTFLQMRSAQAPTSFSWELQLGAGQQLRQLPNGAVAVVSVEEPAGEAESSKEAQVGESGQEAPETEAERAERAAEEAESEMPAPSEEPPPSSPHSSTPPAEAPPGEPQPQETQAQYEAEKQAMARAEAETGETALMVIAPPEMVDAHGHAVAATLSAAGDTLTLTTKPTEATAYPAFAAIAVAAPTDRESDERDPFEYGLADNLSATFTNPNVTRLKEAASPLHIQTARITIPWDILKPFEATKYAAFKAWLANVEKDRLKPYVTLQSDLLHPPPSVGRYREAVRNLLKDFGKSVKKWGAWNEPDQGDNTVPRKRAAHYWQAAQSAAVELRCGCTIVAGELAQYETNQENKIAGENREYAKGYRYYLTRYFPEAWEYRHKANHKSWEQHKRPAVWGLHDYADVINDRTTDLAEFESFARGRALGTPRIWVGEAGVELYNRFTPTRLTRQNDELYEYEAQSEAAETFLELRHAGSQASRIERVYYYSYGAPEEGLAREKPDEFDSGLVEAPRGPHGKDRGEPRPAYCYLAYGAHRCPPSIVSEYGEYMVNPFGIETNVEFTVTQHPGTAESPQTRHLHAGIIHPVGIAPKIHSSCEAFTYSYVGTARNIAGEATLGPDVDGGSGRCIGS